MIMKLELKHIVPYLPYGLKAKLSKEGVFNLDSEYINEYAYSICTITDFTTYSKDLGGSMKVDETKDYRFDFDSLSEIEIILRPLSDLDKDGEINTPEYLRGCCYSYVQNLISQHYDVFGLIEKGLAIDINTLTK